MGNHGTSANSSSHAESSWRLNELTEGEVTIEVGACSNILRLVLKKEDFLQRLPLGPSITLKGRPPRPGRTGGIKKAGVQVQSSRKHIVSGYEVSTKMTPG